MLTCVARMKHNDELREDRDLPRTSSTIFAHVWLVSCVSAMALFATGCGDPAFMRSGQYRFVPAQAQARPASSIQTRTVHQDDRAYTISSGRQAVVAIAAANSDANRLQLFVAIKNVRGRDLDVNPSQLVLWGRDRRTGEWLRMPLYSADETVAAMKSSIAWRRFWSSVVVGLAAAAAASETTQVRYRGTRRSRHDGAVAAAVVGARTSYRNGRVTSSRSVAVGAAAYSTTSRTQIGGTATITRSTPVRAMAVAGLGAAAIDRQARRGERSMQSTARTLLRRNTLSPGAFIHGVVLGDLYYARTIAVSLKLAGEDHWFYFVPSE